MRQDRSSGFIKPQQAMPFKHGEQRQNIPSDAVDDAIPPVDQFTDIRIADFGNHSAAMRIIGKNEFRMVNHNPQ